ncbi:TIGR02444 family protein [Vibrio cionasavignyae]|uniref:TIGR02444 family protein n=1 Tax=Vibrio cionasavignyae TaxID=2910252 RepID=UPI003D1256B8
MDKAHLEHLSLEHLWQFSLQYYGVREIKEACLTIQNHYHGNVNLLLMLKWLDEQQRHFAAEDWHLIQSCLGRTEQLLHHFRRLRRQLKNNVSDNLYREALAFELSVEKQQQSDLVDCINSLTLTTNQHQPLVSKYCQQLGAEHLSPIFVTPCSVYFPSK